MDVAIVLVEQLEEDGMLRTLRMQANYGESITVAFANEYEEERSGPFHFLTGQDEKSFQSAFAECKSRKVSSSRFKKTGEFSSLARLGQEFPQNEEG